ncbi:MAG: hypothetical protein ACKVQA_05350 [Burkholderiales bacterium]
MPPLKLATLPAYAGLLAYMGPGILFAALAQGSGELIWWPYLTAKYGAVFLGLLIAASLLQFWGYLTISIYVVVLVLGSVAYTWVERISMSVCVAAYVPMGIAYLILNYDQLLGLFG